MKHEISSIKNIKRAKKDLKFNFYRIDSYDFYKKFFPYVEKTTQRRWTKLVEQTFVKTNSVTNKGLGWDQFPDRSHWEGIKSWVDLYILLFEDKLIQDPMCVIPKKDGYEIQPGIKRLLCIPYLENHQIEYMHLFDRAPDNYIYWYKKNVYLERLKKENIPAHLHNEDYIKRAKNLDTEVVIEKRRHKIFMNGIKLFEIENNEYKICLPKLMETE